MDAVSLLGLVLIVGSIVIIVINVILMVIFDSHSDGHECVRAIVFFVSAFIALSLGVHGAAIILMIIAALSELALSLTWTIRH